MDSLHFCFDGNGGPKTARYHYNGRVKPAEIVWPWFPETPYRIDGSNLFIQAAFSVEAGEADVQVKEGRAADDLRWATRVKSPLKGELPIKDWKDVTVSRRRSPLEAFDINFFDNFAQSVLSLVPLSLAPKA